MTPKHIQFSNSVFWISALTLMTAGQALAEDDIPPIYNPILWVDGLAAFLHDLLQLGIRLVG